MGNRRGVVLLAAVCLLAACSSGKNTAKHPTGPVSASACTAGAVTGTHNETLAIAGRPRVVRVHIPSQYSGLRPVPLVVNLHGSGSTAAQQDAFSGMDAIADVQSFVVAYPQANIPQGLGYDWNVPGVPLIGGARVPHDAADDISFVKALVSTLEATYCVDRARVYATGFSGGARLTASLACDASSPFAAIAPVSGLRLPSPCASARAVPVISFHGTADPVDPYAGNGQPYWTYSVSEAAHRWAEHDGCGATPKQRTVGATVALTSYEGCNDGAAVQLYTITGEGHEWPGGPLLSRAETRLLGPQTAAVNANDLMWSFFSAHHR